MNASVDVTNVILEADRVRIRPWSIEDLEDFYEYAKVEGVGQMAGWTPHSSIEVSRQILDIFMEGKYTFALEHAEDKRVIGSLGLEKIEVDLGEPYTGMVGREIGYVLSKDYWGRGIMQEAVKRVVQYCFEVERYDFLQCSHFITNNQSKKVIEKCGFSFVKEHTKTRENGEEYVLKYYVLTNGV